MRNLVLTYLCFLICFDAMPSVLDRQVWNFPNHKNRILIRITRRPGSKEGSVEFYSGGLARKDGSDIIVIDKNGTIMKREITSVGPGDRFLVTFELSRPDRYFVYYNSPEGTSIPMPEYSRESGLLLEVFRLNGKSCKDVDELMTIVSDSTELLGSGYRSRVFDGYNPYADSDNFLAVYTGYLNIEEEGTYRFATNSNEASFLFIDNKLVALFPGMHFAFATRGQKSGTINLGTGKHRMDYYHVEFVGGQTAVAGWKPPDAEEFEVIPPTAFVPISPSKIIRRESKEGDHYDFTFSYGEVFQPSRYHPGPIIEMNFQPYFPGNESVRQISWSFGDGKTVNTRELSRLFFESGFRTVTMTILDAENMRHTMKHVVPVFPIDQYNAKKPEETSDRFNRMLAGYNLSFLNREELLTLFYFHISRDDNMAISVGTRLLGLFKENEAKDKIRFLKSFGEFLEGKPFANFGVRERIYTDVISATDDNATVADAKLKLANTYYEQPHKLDKAKELYEVVSSAGNSQLRRNALIGLGNVALEEGRLEKAVDYYRKASEIRSISRARFAAFGSYSFAIESYTRNGDYDQALRMLEIVEEVNPMVRLEGYTLIMYMRILQKRHDSDNAIRFSKLLVDNMATTAYTAEAYDALIKLLQQAGRNDEAEEYLDRFREEFPESRFLRDLDGENSSIVESQPGKGE